MKTVQHTWPLALPSGGLLVLALGALLASAPGALLAPRHLRAQVTYDRILRSADEPQNWLTYNGTYSSQRHSGLDQITAVNVGTWSRSGCFRIRCSEPGSRTRSS